METQITVKEETQLPTVNSDIAADLDSMGLSIKDIVFGRMLLMQNTSERVSDGVAKLGDVVDSETNEILAGTSAPIEVVPLRAVKTWTVYNMMGATPKFMRQEVMTPATEGLAWDDIENGVKIRRDQGLDFFVLSRKELAAGMVFPRVISFRRTSYRAGKSIASQLIKQRLFNQPAYGRSVIIGVDKEKNETNTYAVYSYAPGTVLSPNELTVAKFWAGQLEAGLKTGAVKVSGKEDQEKPVAAPKVHVQASTGDSMY